MRLDEYPPVVRLALFVVPSATIIILILTGAISVNPSRAATGLLIAGAAVIVGVVVALRLSRRRRSFRAHGVERIADIRADEHAFKELALAAGIPQPRGELALLAVVPSREGIQLWRDANSGAELTIRRDVVSEFSVAGSSLHFTFIGREDYPIAVQLVGMFGAMWGMSFRASWVAFERVQAALQPPVAPLESPS